MGFHSVRSLDLCAATQSARVTEHAGAFLLRQFDL